MKIRFISLSLSLCVVAACAPIEEPPAPEEEPPPVEEVAVDEVAAPEEGPVGPDLRAFVWECEDGTRLVTDRGQADAERLTLHLPERTVTLTAEEAASGARYGDGEVTFRSQGREATLEIGDARVTCTENRPASVVESARREGVEVWATGNEPGWNLEIFPDRIVFVTGYGAEKVETPPVEAEIDAEAARTVYRAETDLHTLTVVLRDADCVDSMSGEELPLTVSVELDGTTYLGCGRRLR